MRRLLVVVFVIGSVLFLQAPAQAAVHFYMRIAPDGTSTKVQTECPKGSTVKVTVGTVTGQVVVPVSAYTVFHTSKLNTVAARAKTVGYKNVAATCSPASQGHTGMTVLPFTGMTTSQYLAVGLWLLVLGGLLLRTESSSPRRRPARPRAPVKVYAQ